MTPSGLDYSSLTAELVGVHRLDGSPSEAPLQPTSELPLHLSVYAATGAAAIVHTHSPAATAVSALVDEIPAVHYYVALFGGPVGAPYATYGTDELAAHVVTALHGRSSCLMANHGAFTIGRDLATAYRRAEYLEWLLTSTCGPPRPGPRACSRPPRSSVSSRRSPPTASGRPRPGSPGSDDPTVDVIATTLIPPWRRAAALSPGRRAAPGYRRQGGEWKVVLRHADELPAGPDWKMSSGTQPPCRHPTTGKVSGCMSPPQFLCP